MYFRVDDKLHSHVKAMRAGVEALGLWVMAASWSASQLTDGWVPEYAARRLVGDPAPMASALVRAGLWHEEERDGEPGWVFHEWDEWQHTREYVQERQRRARERMQRVRANSARSAPNPNPNPNPKNTPAADAASETSEAFDAFWAAYPRKVGKTAAAKAHAKALRTTDAETILAGVHNAVAVWSASRTEDRFIPHPSSWLNAGRWADEQPTLPGTPQQARPSRTLAQCDGTACPGGRHEWTDAANTFVCQGA